MSKKLFQSFIAIGCVVLVSSYYSRPAMCAEPPEPPPAVAAPEQATAPEPEVLEKGPIHEAFAEPLMLEQQEPLVVAKQPPEPINELPPDEKPSGRNIQWIKGYWAYNEELEDFVWVSGLWRDVPPKREWVSGEWQEVEGGYVWTPGFWAEGDAQEVQYLPTPPESLEQGPSSPAPGENYLWAPGCWRFDTGRYAWQPGFWYQAQPNWVWVPNHYCYTSRGSVFVNGYWDYPLARRGLLYAPVYWGVGYRGWHVGAYYRPHSVINTGLLIANLFVHNRHGHYYYGYGRGAVPHWLHGWGSHSHSRWGYYGGGHHKRFDPVWAHYKWHDRHGRHGGHRDDWAQKVRGKGDRDGPGSHKQRMVTSVERMDRRRRDTLKMRQIDSDEVASYMRRAEAGGKRARVQVGQGQAGAGQIARDSDRKAWSTAKSDRKVTQNRAEYRPGTRETVRQGRDFTRSRAGAQTQAQVRSGDKRSRSFVQGSQKGNSQTQVRANPSVRQRSVLSNPGVSTSRNPKRSSIVRQSYQQPVQRSTRSYSQRRAVKSPNSGSVQRYSRSSSSRGQSSFQRGTWSSSQGRSSSRSFQRSRGNSGGRGGGGGSGRSRRGR